MKYIYLVLVIVTLFYFSRAIILAPITKKEPQQIESKKGNLSENLILDVENLNLNGSEDVNFIWIVYKKYIPIEYQQQIKQVEIIKKDSDQSVATIKKNINVPNSFNLKLNINNLKRLSPKNQLEEALILPILMHETGHQISLQDDQINAKTNTEISLSNLEYQDKFYSNQSKCLPNYYLKEGCSIENSYINRFYNQFWLKDWDEYSKIQNIKDDELFRSQSLKFYNKNKDSFVSENAFFNPEEDFAESFRYFIMNSKPQNNRVSDEKINFFHKIQKFVDIKNQINYKLSITKNYGIKN